MNVHEAMMSKLDEYRKKDPKYAYRFIDKNELKTRTEVEKYELIKEQGSGTLGEVAVGDLVLARRPREVDEEIRRHEYEVNAAALANSDNQFYDKLNRIGGAGTYLQPLTPNQLARDRDFKGGKK